MWGMAEKIKAKTDHMETYLSSLKLPKRSHGYSPYYSQYIDVRYTGSNLYEKLKYLKILFPLEKKGKTNS